MAKLTNEEIYNKCVLMGHAPIVFNKAPYYTPDNELVVMLYGIYNINNLLPTTVNGKFQPANHKFIGWSTTKSPEDIVIPASMFYDEQGNVKYFVKGEIFSFGHQLHVYDMYNNEIGSVHEKIFSFPKKFEIVINGVDLNVEGDIVEIKEQFKKFTITGIYLLVYAVQSPLGICCSSRAVSSKPIKLSITLFLVCSLLKVIVRFLSLFISFGTWSVISYATVPFRGENVKVCTFKNSHFCTKFTLSIKSFSLSPGNPTIISVVNTGLSNSWRRRFIISV